MKPTGTQQVEDFLRQLNHPFKPEIEEVRRLVLQAAPSLTEHIKWNAPSFCQHHQDRITFQLAGEKGFRLIFHCGAKGNPIPPQAPLLHDPSGWLSWPANDRAVATFGEMADVRAREAVLTALVQQWLAVTQPAP
ncbi:DUF1801 domain-containing protein [Rufibacter ruber]|uniref:DUF1801 domain-containing protein n=1 Tax=Rufibacter ruber TaxID=1783499 RepID=UPI000835E3E5|nr:DUF1801 domain-containing protein [Rufibacter ruber]